MRHFSEHSRTPRWRLAGTVLGWAAWAGGVQAQEPTPTQWLLHTGGLSHHVEQTRAPGRQWRERHPGLGLERRQVDSDGWHWRQSAGLLQDSRGHWGGHAGAALMREWRMAGPVSLGVGLGGHVFYRSVSWSGRRAWVPALLPTLSLGLLDDRLGLNLMLVPPVGPTGERRPALLYLQLTTRFR